MRRPAAADVARSVRTPPLVWVVPPVVLVLAALFVFPAGGSDDSYITYWAARSLAETGEILNYNGERLEQSSSLLHTVVLATGSWLTGMSVPAVGHVVAPTAAVAVVVATMALTRRLRREAALLAGVLAATSSYLLFWTFGGLETTLAAAALVAGVLACARIADGAAGRRDWAAAIAAIVAVVFVRPEGGLVLGATVAGAAVLERISRRRTSAGRLAVLLGIVVVTFGVAALLRLAYFGAALPNPVTAKTGDVVASEGWHYVQTWWISRFHLPLLAVAAVGAVSTLRRAQSATPALVTCAFVAVAGFVLTSGGDWMQGGRFLVPAVPFLAALAASAVVVVPWRIAGAGVLVAVQVLGVVSLAAHRSTATPLWTDATFTPASEVTDAFGWYELRNRVHARNAALYVLADDVVGQLVRTADGPVTVAGAQAGLTIYRLFETYGDDVRFVDRYNLVTDEFGACDDLLEPSFRGLGREMTYAQWLPNAARCGVPPPDVVIEYDTIAQHPALADAYTTVASVPFVASRAGPPLRGVAVGTAQFVAVRNELVDRVSPPTSGS